MKKIILLFLFSSLFLNGSDHDLKREDSELVPTIASIPTITVDDGVTGRRFSYGSVSSEYEEKTSTVSSRDSSKVAVIDVPEKASGLLESMVNSGSREYFKGSFSDGEMVNSFDSSSPRRDRIAKAKMVSRYSQANVKIFRIFNNKGMQTDKIYEGGCLSFLRCLFACCISRPSFIVLRNDLDAQVSEENNIGKLIKRDSFVDSSGSLFKLKAK